MYAATSTMMRNATEPAMIPASVPVERPPESSLSGDDDGEALAMAVGKYLRIAWSPLLPALTVIGVVGSVGVSTVTAVLRYVLSSPNSVVVYIMVLVKVTASVE